MPSHRLKDRLRRVAGLNGVQPEPVVTLVIVADDFGLHPAYDRGILEAAGAGAIDAASLMVLRGTERVGELVATGVEIGLHLEAAGVGEELDEGGLLAQLAEFERVVGRGPDYLDGHHHCHVVGAVASVVARWAGERGVAVRSVGPEHRRVLRGAGVPTPDLLVGRYVEGQPVLPRELSDLPDDLSSVEWMVHPGHPDPGSGSTYDRGRGEDLEALLDFECPPHLVRGSHADL